MKAATHPQQAARIAALRGYDILDTPREQDFDEIVALASEICGAPISVVNLIDADRQWFKAEVGLGVRETPLETSLCAHAILEEDYLEIPDTLADARMRDNALCAGEPGLRFYAGALLSTEEGLPLGTLCVLDYRPRTLTPFQRRALRTLANQVMSQLDLRRALRQQVVLRHEFDHRVKNSLQSVSALVRLQRRRVTDGALQDVLESVENRILTVSLLHEALYRNDGAGVDLASYVARIGDLLRSMAPPGVTLEIAVVPCVLDAERAAAAGIIIAEFVANSLKHAFPDDRPGVVQISTRAGHGVVTLVCEDDGVGAATGPAGDGLGLRIMAAAASQLGGEMVRTVSADGCRLTVAFAP